MLQNLNWDKTSFGTKLKLGCNSKRDTTHIEKNLKLCPNFIKCTNFKYDQYQMQQNSDCDKAIFVMNSTYYKTQTVTKLKLWQNSNYDKTQIMKKLKYSKTLIVTVPILWQNSNSAKTKIKLWLNWNCVKTQTVI